MMGHREKLSATETDALSHRSRGLRGWKPGTISKLKRAVSKRLRASGRAKTKNQA